MNENPVLNQDFDVCVFGSGPAGITVARKLAAAGKTVGLFEAGGLEYDDASQSVYEGESVGREYPTAACRLRYFGGTSNHWAGRCGIFDEIDFTDRREFWGLPGWPLQRNEVLAHLHETKQILDLQGQNFEQRELAGWTPGEFRNSIYARSTPTRFGEKYRAELTNSQLITVHLNANLLTFDLDRATREIQHAEVANYGGKRFSVRGKHYVLCLGALENARFLLNCNLKTETSIGNQSDYLGRCFMEHLDVQLGRFVTTDNNFWSNGPIALSPNGQLIAQKNIGNGVLAFNPSIKTRSYGRLRILKEAARDILCANDTSRGLTRKYVNINCDGDGAITALFEQTPNPASRVTLDDKLDVFGQRRLRLNWELSPADLHSLRVASLEAAKAMAKQDKARVQLFDFVLNPSLDMPISIHCHQMGTTRMSADPRFGVVDQNCKVHNSPNLYIGGSSVFPTGGGTNPTLTIVLLALRLGHHLATLN